MVDRLSSRTRSALLLWPVVVLRLYAGFFFAWNGISKLIRDNFAGGLAGFLNA
ncbi:MAG: hypothetical protein OEM63_09805 [Gammaproteobacteria bacterium]|nr:hypothetical protein [Gammaproteobacteria bacterium]